VSAPAALPASLFGYAWQAGRRHQLALGLMAVAIFLLTMGPLELQRRIVNSALASGEFGRIAWLCAAYGALVAGAGAIKLLFNVHRGWLGETAVRDLRRRVYAHGIAPHDGADLDAEGVDMSIILAEAEPVGGFVATSFSEPLMQIGTLLTVFGYMIALEPWIALFSIFLVSVQVLFIPRLQRMINRRAADRIQTMRALGGAMIDDFGPGTTPAARQRAFHERVDRVFVLNVEIFWRKFLMNFLMNLTHHFGLIGVLLVGGWLIVEGRLEVGTVVAFISGLKQVNDPWGDLVNYLREMAVSQVKYRLIAAVLDGPPGAAAAPPGAGAGPASA
jgi:ABC-type multidrug transport system fused ATPase/permease subunit